MHRDGFASVLALVFLAVGATLVTALLAGAHVASRQAADAESRLVVGDLLADGERIACTWLQQCGNTLVLPPSGGLLLLCDQRWQDASGRPMRLAIAVHDALATLPRAALVAGHPLRFALASPGSGPVMRLNPESIAPADLLAAVDLPAGWVRIPNDLPSDQPPGAVLAPERCAAGPVLACWFAPDNTGALNANTAPAAILRAAATDSTLDVEAILTQRRDGRHWDGPVVSTQHGVQIVPASSRWQILLVAERANVHAARWAIGDGTGGAMRIIRRHDASARSTSASAP